MIKIYAKIALIFFFYLATLIYPYQLYANTISLPFSDNFEDGNIFDDWTSFSGNWGLEFFNNSTWLAIHSAGSSDNEIQVGDMSLQNYEFSVDVHKIQGEDLNFFFRIQPNRYTGLQGHNLPVGYGLHMKHGRFALQKFTTTLGTEIPTAIVSESFLNNTIKNIKVRLEANNIKVFTENSDTPIINYTDNDNPFLNGGVALASITGDLGTDFQFDNFFIDNINPSPSPTPLPSLNVLELKQYSEPWKNQVYDTATRWTTNPTIERWGCALTSASMILKFWGHGDYANPDQLNNWLKSQPDGYLGDGYINWLAVTRFSLIHSSSGVPALEFKRLENSQNNLANELNQGRPAVLKLPSHFVVARGQTSDSFEINDPVYSDRPTLASYGNTFDALNTFTPTYTDLSYLLLTIEPAFTLKVFNEKGDEIVGNTYIENPLTDDVDNGSSKAKPLKIFMLQKPEDDKYTVEVSGKKGGYNLTTYIYSPDGSVDKSKKEGYLSKNSSKDKIKIKRKYPWPSIPKFPWLLKDLDHE